MGRKGPWPKGVPRKGWKESGLSFQDWVARHTVPVTPQDVPKKISVDTIPSGVIEGVTGGPYHWGVVKDEWARQMIEVRDVSGRILARRQRTRVDIAAEAAEMAREASNA